MYLTRDPAPDWVSSVPAGKIELLKILLQSDDVALTVIGDGKSLDKMKELPGSYGLDRRVKFTGRIPDSELADIVAASSPGT